MDGCLEGRIDTGLPRRGAQLNHYFIKSPLQVTYFAIEVLRIFSLIFEIALKRSHHVDILNNLEKNKLLEVVDKTSLLVTCEEVESLKQRLQFRKSLVEQAILFLFDAKVGLFEWRQELLLRLLSGGLRRAEIAHTVKAGRDSLRHCHMLSMTLSIMVFLPYLVFNRKGCFLVAT